MKNLLTHVSITQSLLLGSDLNYQPRESVDSLKVQVLHTITLCC